MKYLQLALFTTILLTYACKPTVKTETADSDTTEVIEYNNPPADGFNIEKSSPIAVLIADQVMNAMGGRDQWNSVEGLSWNFLGVRTLLWDKKDNRVKIYSPSTEMTISLDMNNMSGRVWMSGEEVSNQDTVQKYLQRGKEMWINDSYWLVMPFKLKDSGVTLTYAREDTTLQGNRSDVLRMTFENVGVTPQNAYEIWVDQDSKLIKQWAYFKNADQEDPNFVLPWTDYKSYNGLMLSGERGDRDITDIQVFYESIDDNRFEKPGPIQ